MEPLPLQGCARQLSHTVMFGIYRCAGAATLAMSVIDHTLTQVTVSKC